MSPGSGTSAEPVAAPGAPVAASGQVYTRRPPIDVMHPGSRALPATGHGVFVNRESGSMVMMLKVSLAPLHAGDHRSLLFPYGRTALDQTGQTGAMPNPCEFSRYTRLTLCHEGKTPRALSKREFVLPTYYRCKRELSTLHDYTSFLIGCAQGSNPIARTERAKSVTMPVPPNSPCLANTMRRPLADPPGCTSGIRDAAPAV